MSDRKKRWIVLAAFAAAGLALAMPLNVMSLPGYVILKQFVSFWELDERLVPLLLIANAAAYATLGYLVGLVLFAGSLRQRVIALGIILAMALALLGYIISTRARPSPSIGQLRDQMLASLRADPNDVYALHWLGFHHFSRTARFDQAEEYFSKVVDLESQKGAYSTFGRRSLIYLAIICQRRDDHDRAEGYYQKFMATNPDLQRDMVFRNYSNRYLNDKKNR
ncbi:MAG TPA: tetratricopeptide repeat protein [Sedimentisphaerales bacterium]|nr:tetratricopeptide repeat protein [Sedimentisphaerales bacterium]